MTSTRARRAARIAGLILLTAARVLFVIVRGVGRMIRGFITDPVRAQQLPVARPDRQRTKTPPRQLTRTR